MKRTIYLAEDDDDDIFFFKEAIASEQNLDLKIFKDGEQLIKTLENEVPGSDDIIFLDINMPCKNGIECLKEIRAEEKWKSVPVIILSSSNHPRDLQKIILYGANRYIRKSECFSNLQKEINKVLRSKKSELIIK